LFHLFSTCTVEITQYALKGQKLLAQGVWDVAYDTPSFSDASSFGIGIAFSEASSCIQGISP